MTEEISWVGLWVKLEKPCIHSWCLHCSRKSI